MLPTMTGPLRRQRAAVGRGATVPNARVLWAAVALIAVAVCSLFLFGAVHAQDGDGDGEEAFSGTLRFGGEPVEGVRIVVADAAGEAVGEAVSGADGKWRIALPGPGTYGATIDTDTLPEGVTLRDPARRTLEVTVTAGRSQPLIFALGEPVARGPTLPEQLAQAVLNGTKFGLIIAMCAIGLSLIFGLTGLINFAHGELVTLGAILAWYLNADTVGVPLILAGALAVLVAGAAGGGVEFSLLRPLRARRLGGFQFMVVTIGLSLLVRHVLLLLFGPDRERYVDYALQAEWTFGPFAATPRDLTIMALSAAILVAVALFLQKAHTGKAIRAVADNPDLAESSGIDVDRVILIVWVAGAALAAVGGVFFGSVEAVDWLMGFRLLLLMFAAVVLGGLGTAYGAMVGGLLIGLVTEVSTVWASPEIKAVFALGVLVAALLLRPQGLLGQRERIG